MSNTQLLFALVYVVVLVVPAQKLLHRAGYTRWLAILAIIPVVNLIALWVFAFAHWPTRRRVM